MAIEIVNILQDFAIIMIVAAFMTLISYKLKQPLILGYIGAGIIIGPHTPAFNLISNTDVLNLFAEIGIILLLFTVGMEFPIQKLKNIGKKAAIITVIEQIATLVAGFFVARELGFTFYNSLFISVAMSVSSTCHFDENIGRIKDTKRRIVIPYIRSIDNRRYFNIICVCDFAINKCFWYVFVN